MPGGDVLEYFEAEKNKHINAAQDIIDTARVDGRNPTEDETAEIKVHTTAAQEFMQKALAETNARELEASVNRMADAMKSEPVRADHVRVRSLGDAFVASNVYAQIKETGIPSGTWESQEVEFLGAAGDAILESTGSNDDALDQTFVPDLKAPGKLQGPVTLADLFAQGTMGAGNSLRYPKVTTRTAPPEGETAEGAAKPGADFAFDDVVETLGKHAAFSGASEELFEDSPVIRDYINAQLPLMVRQNEEKDFADEVYAAAGDTAVAADIGGASNGWDGIAAGIASVQINSRLNVRADGLFINPQDWWELAVSKTGQDVYYAGGPTSAAGGNPWGLTTVVSLTAPQGFPLVGAFGFGGQVWRKGGVRFAVTNGYNDYFRRDLLAIRAVVRSLLAIYYPECFVIVDLAS